MTRCCDLTGVGAQTGHRVSHSNRKSKRRFEPNIQKASLLSDALGVPVGVYITVATLRSVDHNGGLDNFLLTRADRSLTVYARNLKKRIQKALDAKKEKAA